MGTVIEYINYAVSLLFVICYSYQFFYILVAIFRKPVKFKKTDIKKRYAFMICARNESGVIEHLIRSIKAQTYPEDMYDIYVCADNCTDNTALICEQEGAIVYERFNKKRVGKGYALEFLFDKVTEMCGDDYYDGYLIFDADNLLDKRYLAEMNKAVCAGHNIITSYRNSKNYGKNWISAGYAQWFLREAKHLNNSRMILGTSCAISGTGFLVTNKIIKENGGWKYFLLTEDIELTIDNVLKGEKVAYCNAAKFYDEQPETFKDSWHQRKRWIRGYFQVMKKYGKGLFKGFFGTNAFSCFDMTMNNLPAAVLTLTAIFLNAFAVVISLITNSQPLTVIMSILEACRNTYLLMLVVGFAIVFSEWKEIRCSNWRKIAFTFTFPIFMTTYAPIVIAALFTKVEWKPIKHNDIKTIDDMNKKKRK